MTFRIAVVQPMPTRSARTRRTSPTRSISSPAPRRKAPTSSASRRPIRGPGACRLASIRHRASPRPPPGTASTRSTARSSRSATTRAPRTTSSAWPMATAGAGRLPAHASERAVDLTGGKWWEFQYVPGNEFPVFDIAHGKVGLAMCSEAYMPEVTRALAMRGAELIFMPAGTDKRKLWATWRNLIWSRAIENLAIVVTTQNCSAPTSAGLPWWRRRRRSCSRAPPRACSRRRQPRPRRAMRATTDTVVSSQSYAAKQGVLGPQWQRPELRETIYERK